ncbi:MAG: hypothetical protein H6811_08590 [Phycisphaeraceae bacterium]|nr:hypothetical protein [Phycisphaeraceae bacterium]
MRQAMCRGVSRTVARAFSLVELLVVIMIIVIVIAIILPSLGGARNVAKAATTETIAKQLGNAVDRFRQDRDGLLPGVFSPAEMGDQENADTYGFTTMENVILDLAGGIEDRSGLNSGGSQGLNFGPTAAAHALNTQLKRFVRPGLIGTDYSGNPGYYEPDGKTFVRQKHTSTDGVNSQWSAGSVAFGTSEADIPDVVDAWGNAMILWIEDDTGPGVISSVQDFARVDSRNPSRFYWAANAGFLKSTELGQSGKDQTQSANREFSLLGDGVANATLETTLAGLLGNPAYPTTDDLDSVSDPTTLLPAAARGRAVVMSAGADGIYFGSRDTGAKRLSADSAGLRYGYNFFTTGGVRHVKGGASTINDVTGGFKDIIQTFGN